MLAVDEPRLNSLYDEALRLNPSTLTNAGALLTRVFLELSTEHFLKTMKVPVPPKHERSGRSHWSDFGISLKEKIACALKVLDPEEHNRDLKQPRNRSEEHTSELQSLMRISYAVFCLKKKKTT